MFSKKGVLRNFAKFTRKHLCQRLFFNKIAEFRPATSLKKSLSRRYFPVNFAKFLRTTFLQNISGRLLLKYLQSGSLSSVAYILKSDWKNEKLRSRSFFDKE